MAEGLKYWQQLSFLLYFSWLNKLTLRAAVTEFIREDLGYCDKPFVRQPDPCAPTSRRVWHGADSACVSPSLWVRATRQTAGRSQAIKQEALTGWRSQTPSLFFWLAATPDLWPADSRDNRVTTERRVRRSRSTNREGNQLWKLVYATRLEAQLDKIIIPNITLVIHLIFIWYINISIVFGKLRFITSTKRIW